MPMLRVYQPPGNVPCRIFRPNERHRFDSEGDQTFLTRMAAIAEANDRSLQGVPFLDTFESNLPVTRVDTTGPTALNVRAAWRVQGAAVVVDPAEIVALNGQVLLP